MVDEINIPQTIETSSQVLPDALRNPYGTNSYLYTSSMRGGLLPAYGTRARLLALRELYRNDYNYMVRGAFSGIAKRIASLPFEIRGRTDGQYPVQYYQDILNEANFGEGWASLVKQIVLDFLRYDTGAFVEVIAEGDTLSPVDTPIMGLSMLDALRCYPTGDPQYPVVYWDNNGQAHLLHETRVIRIYDMPDNDEVYRGWGDSALARAVSIAYQQIYMGRYVEQRLDDNPPAGIMVAQNLSRQEIEKAIASYERNRNTDGGGIWGQTVWLYGMGAENAVKLESVQFSNPPEKFDYKTYTELNIDQLALALGVDRQELWQLSGGSLGSGMQSEILNLKARGKTLGDLISNIERIINRLLPDDMTFTFSYRDETESLSEANEANMWAQAVAVMGGNLNQQEARQLLANNVKSVREVTTDSEGRVVSLSDTQTLEDMSDEATLTDTETETPQGAGVIEDTDTPEELVDTRMGGQRYRHISSKAYPATQADFTNQVGQLIIQGISPNNRLSKSAWVASMKALLASYGERAYIDGLAEGGIGASQISDDDFKRIMKVQRKQSSYVDGLASAVYGNEIGFGAARARAVMWGKSLQSFYNEGLLSASADQNYMWVIGATEEHCETCLRLNGQVHRMSAWKKRNLLPRADKLECKGFRCDCKLVKTNERGRGRF